MYSEYEINRQDGEIRRAVLHLVEIENKKQHSSDRLGGNLECYLSRPCHGFEPPCIRVLVLYYSLLYSAGVFVSQKMTPTVESAYYSVGVYRG